MPVSQTRWRGVAAYALENAILRTVVVPEMGAKIVSLLDKRNNVEWLVGAGSRPFQPVAYGSSFEHQDMSGWDEMFPTISACTYPGPGALTGTLLPDHGEVWALPWQVKTAGAGTLELEVAGRCLPYRLTRRLAYQAPSMLRFDYHLVNLGMHPMPYIWAAHPQFAVGLDAEVTLPPHVAQVCNVLPASWGWGDPETLYDWPEVTSAGGLAVRLDKIGPPALQRARKYYLLPEQRAGWAMLVRKSSGAWLRMDWDPTLVPYFGLWVDEGALNPESVAAPEPATGFYDSLALAWERQQVALLAAGAEAQWTVTVRFGTSEEPYEQP
jgi:galactose mutarotase-like enzyme